MVKEPTEFHAMRVDLGNAIVKSNRHRAAAPTTAMDDVIHRKFWFCLFGTTTFRYISAHNPTVSYLIAEPAAFGGLRPWRSVRKV